MKAAGEMGFTQLSPREPQSCFWGFTAMGQKVERFEDLFDRLAEGAPT